MGHPHLSCVMYYSYCSCIAAREFRSEWKPSSPSMAAASNGMLSDAVVGGISPGVFPSVVDVSSSHEQNARNAVIAMVPGHG